MNTGRQPYRTFGQLEGLEPLPRQLNKEEVTRKLRARLWAEYDALMESFRLRTQFGDDLVTKEGRSFLEGYYLHVKGEFADQVPTQFDRSKHLLRSVFLVGSSLDIMNLIHFSMSILNHHHPLLANVETILEQEMSAYRIVDGNKIVRTSSDEEASAISGALMDATNAGASGARAHLRNAIDALNSGEFSDSVRESISAVESVAKVLSSDPKTTLSKALAKLERSSNIHGSMKDAFNSLYGYTSDEKGIRHALFLNDKANVDETDALFMIGACSSFVSYLISRAADAGISLSDT